MNLARNFCEIDELAFAKLTVLKINTEFSAQSQSIKASFVLTITKRLTMTRTLIYIPPYTKIKQLKPIAKLHGRRINE